jgi:hypothetical protein
MVKTETIIAVDNVPESARFYTNLLDCKAEHGGETFEILTSGDTVILCLHKWGQHEHPSMISPNNEAANGLILFFRVDNLLQIFENANTLNAAIEKKTHYNKNSLKNQFTLRDPDQYYLIISE